ncbi:50S ribosomal protein L11 methyltransferase [Bengtsoniella intestinalis]|uniref:50S ribosomal protein L11 methyltransferase n=1 Tax=Bengtsoniella intestinalis TaxID=3073143 RepID=UPI00391F3190
MSWIGVKIDTVHHGLEGLETLLSTMGIDGLVIEDEQEFETFLEENRQCWDYVDEDLSRDMAGKSRITFYVEADETGFSTIALVRLALETVKKSQEDWGSLLMTLENLEEEDWAYSWQKYYRPMEIGDRLLVVPEWEQTTMDGRVSLILNPGLTFGTGSHTTTRLCLTAMERLVQQGQKVLDLGCGSGILSIAGLKLGAKSAVGCDIDPLCHKVAYENAALNGITPATYTVLSGDILTDKTLQTAIGTGYDLVVANIVADVILAISKPCQGLIAEGGTFLCSGIIDDRGDEVEAGLKADGWHIVERQQREGWCAFTCKL